MLNCEKVFFFRENLMLYNKIALHRNVLNYNIISLRACVCVWLKGLVCASNVWFESVSSMFYV